jgi:hypothetical protein
LADYTKALSEEVRLLKEASQANMQLQQEQYRIFLNQQRNAVCQECQDAKKSDNAKDAKEDPTPIPEEKPWTLIDWQNQLRWNILRMSYPTELSADAVPSIEVLQELIRQKLENNSDTNSSSSSSAAAAEADLSAACDLLLMYFNNLLKNPTVPRYRRMSTINGSYVKSLSTVQHHAAVLTAVGFLQKPDSTYYEYEWHALPTTVNEVSDSSVKEGKDSSKQQGECGRSAPATVGEARMLLEEAVQLLGALKVSRTALLQALQAKVTDSASTVAAGEMSSDGAALEPAGAKAEASVSAPEPTSSNSNVSASSQPSAAPQTATSAPLADQQLISVADVTEGEGRLLGSGDASEAVSDNLDFMKVCQQYDGAGACLDFFCTQGSLVAGNLSEGLHDLRTFLS